MTEKDERRNMFNLRLINQVRSQTHCDPLVTYIQNDMAIHDFDRVMVNVSIGLAHHLMVERIIGNISVFVIKRDK